MDKDPEKYSVEVLRHWKAQAESNSAVELGKVIPSKTELDITRSLVFKTPLGESVTQALAQIGKQSTEELEAKDPRFAVEIGYKKGETNIALHPREPVRLSVRIAGEYKSEFASKWSSLVDHGEDLELPSKALTMHGSPLIESLWSLDGKIAISTNLRKRAIQKTYFVQASGDREIAIDDFHGEIVGGAKSVRFLGDACGGHVHASFNYVWPDANRTSVDDSITFELKFSQWRGKSVLHLPYFEKIFSFFQRLASAEKLRFEVEIDGAQILAGSAGDLHESDEMKETHFLLRYTRNVKEILELIGADISFPDDCSISFDEMNSAEQMWHMLYEYPKLSGKAIGDVQCSFVPTHAEGVAFFQEAIRPEFQGAEIRIINTDTRKLNVFGSEIELPSVVFDFSSAKLRLQSVADIIEIGKATQFAIVPTEVCNVAVSFQK